MSDHSYMKMKRVDVWNIEQYFTQHFTDRYDVDIIFCYVVLVSFHFNYRILLELSALNQVCEVSGDDNLNAILTVR